MILTEKGSTRGTVSILLIAALIFLTARVAVNLIEDNFPLPKGDEIAWNKIPDVLKGNEEALDESLEDTPAKPDASEPASNATESELKPDTKLGAAPEKKPPRKRFAVERLFPDNVDQKPLLIFFSDEGSVLSRRMEHVTLAIPAVKEKIERDFYPVKVSFDKNLNKTEYRIYKTYGSAASPLLSVRSSTGDQLAYATGYLNAVKTMVLLTNALEAQRKLLQGGKD